MLKLYEVIEYGDKSLLRNYLKDKLGDLSNMDESKCRQLFELLKEPNRQNKLPFICLARDDTLNNDSTALDLFKEILDIPGDPSKNANLQQYMNEVCEKRDNNGDVHSSSNYACSYTFACSILK